MKFIQLITTMFAGICVGTVAIEAVTATVLWSNGRLSGAKITQLFAVAYGVDQQTLDEELAAAPDSDDSEQPPFEATIVARSLHRLDLDLREMAVDNAVGNLKFFREQLEVEKNQYDKTRQQFEARHQMQRDAATDESLLQVQNTLIPLPPRQAKDQIQRFLADGANNRDDRAMNDLVTIIKSMPLDKRKKILAEFKTDTEQEQLGDILQKIRLGVPNLELIRKTREQLRQIQPKTIGGSKNDFDSV